MVLKITRDELPMEKGVYRGCLLCPLYPLLLKLIKGNFLKQTGMAVFFTRQCSRGLLSTKTGLPFQMFHCSPKINYWHGTKQKVVFHLISNQVFRKCFENGKQPSIWISVIGNLRKS